MCREGVKPKSAKRKAAAMRRKDREQTVEFAWDVLERCPFGMLSLIDLEGRPYAIPVSPAVMDGAIYFHGAKHGEKAKIMAANPEACLTAVVDVVPLPEEYATRYASAVVKGTMSLVEQGTEEWLGALHAIVDHYAPENQAYFDTSIVEEGNRTAVWKLTPTEITGKARLV